MILNLSSFVEIDCKREETKIKKKIIYFFHTSLEKDGPYCFPDPFFSRNLVYQFTLPSK